MIEEGKVKLLADGVFYNPKMRFCRNLDVLVLNAIDSREYLDALAATGVRGLRAAVEAGKTPIFNDRDPKAVEVIRRNLELNGIEAEVHCSDANVLMRQRRFEHIDIDPFGSPAAFIDSACWSAKFYLSVTATDTAALCGSSTSAGLRKYAAYAVKCDVYHEIGLRMLAGFVCREATKYEKVVVPIAAWAREHYYRIHFRVKKSTAMSAKVYEEVGHIFYCPSCSSKVALPLGETAERCSCGSKLVPIGPLWLGRLKDPDVVSRAIEAASGAEKRFLERLSEEIDCPTAYNVQRIAQRLGAQSPKVSEIIERLNEMGYEASKTHYCGFCVKTSAGIKEIEEVISSLRRG